MSVLAVITNHIKELREKRMHSSSETGNWTQEGLAKRLGIARQTLILMEKGTYNPSLALAFKLAREFNMTIMDIFDDGDDEIET